MTEEAERRWWGSNVRLLHATTVPMTLRFLCGQIGFMVKRGFGVGVLSSPGPELDAFAVQQGIPRWIVSMRRRIAPLADIAAIARLWWVLRRVHPQIVHAHTPKAGLLAMIAAWLVGTPVRIYHMHGLPFMTARGPKRWLLRRCEQVSCRLATQVLCVSQSIRNVAVNEGLCDAAKIKVLASGTINGVAASAAFNPSAIGSDTRTRVRSEYGIPDDRLVVGFVGRIVRDKGWVELADAWRALRAEFLNLHLLVVGPFETQDPVPSDIRELLCTDPRVHLVGVEWNTPPLYAAMDVFVLPSYREGFPISPLEAAAMALPVVATTIPGCIEAVRDGTTGTLVPPKDAAALTSAIRTYLIDPELRRRHGVAGRARVLKDFRQEVIWEATYIEYCRLLEASGLPIPSTAVRRHKGFARSNAFDGGAVAEPR